MRPSRERQVYVIENTATPTWSPSTPASGVDLRDVVPTNPPLVTPRRAPDRGGVLCSTRTASSDVVNIAEGGGGYPSAGWASGRVRRKGRPRQLARAARSRQPQRSTRRGRRPLQLTLRSREPGHDSRFERMWSRSPSHSRCLTPMRRETGRPSARRRPPARPAPTKCPRWRRWGRRRHIGTLRPSWRRGRGHVRDGGRRRVLDLDRGSGVAPFRVTSRPEVTRSNSSRMAIWSRP